MKDNINLSVSFRPFFSNVYCKADARFYDVLQVQISSWPLWIQQIISFVTTITFIFPILTVVWLVLNSTVSFPLESMVNSIAKRLAGVFSVECQQPAQVTITLANYNGPRKSGEPIKTRYEHM